MDKETIKILISVGSGSIGGALISVTSAYFINKFNTKRNSEEKREREVQQLNMIAMQYPYLEDDDFCDNWSRTKTSDEKYLRYDNYCVMVFNLIGGVWEQFKKKRKKIDSFLYVEELVKKHKKWWLDPYNNSENSRGYDKDFIKFVNTYLVE